MGFWTPGSSGQLQDQVLQQGSDSSCQRHTALDVQHRRPSQALRQTKNPLQLSQHHAGLPGDAALAHDICSGLLGRHCRDLHQCLSLASPNCPRLEMKETATAALKTQIAFQTFLRYVQ